MVPGASCWIFYFFLLLLSMIIFSYWILFLLSVEEFEFLEVHQHYIRCTGSNDYCLTPLLLHCPVDTYLEFKANIRTSRNSVLAVDRELS